MDEIVQGKLWLGNFRDAHKAIKSRSVDCIINVCRKGYETPKAGIFCHHIAIQDTGHESTIPYMTVALKLLQLEISKSKKVLIHCAKGVSRSAALTVAYLMLEMNMEYIEAYNYLLEKRKRINPNKFELVIKTIVKAVN